MPKIDNFDEIFRHSLCEDPTFGLGHDFKLPKCKTCKYSKGATCIFYNKHKGKVLEDEDQDTLSECTRYEEI